MKTEQGWYVTKKAEAQWEEFEKKKKRFLTKDDSLKNHVKLAIVEYKGNAPRRSVCGIRYVTADIGIVGDRFAEIWIKSEPRDVVRLGVKSGVVYVVEEK